MPQCPCEVYSQRHTSAIFTSESSLRFFLNSRSADLHDAVVGPGAGGLLVLLGRQTEEQQAANPKRRAGLGLFHRLVDREVEDPGHGADLFANAFAGADKHRIDQRAGTQMRLAHQRPHRLGSAQPAHTCDRKVHPSSLLVRWHSRWQIQRLHRLH